jgi:transposase
LINIVAEGIFVGSLNNRPILHIQGWIIMDNAGSYHNDLIKEAIIKSGNQNLYSVPYTPKSNSIEQYLNQLKYYLKKYRNVNDFQHLKQHKVVRI